MEKIISNIDNVEFINYDESFQLASYCSKLLSSKDENKQYEARKIVIHILAKLHKLDQNTYTLWTDIIEAVGFYPYIEKNKDTLNVTSLSDEIRKEYHSSNYIEKTYFHLEQKKLSEYIQSGKNVIASAPTSFGKSLLIEEVVASEKYKNIVIIQPTLALLDETRLKMKKYNDKYKIIVRTSQPFSEEKGNLFLLTAERVMEYDNLPHIDFLIIDEFYKLSLKRKDDRADALNNAFLKIINKFKCNFYFLGPNIDSISEGFAQKYNAVFYKSDFSLVDCNVINLYEKICWGNSDKKKDAQKEAILFDLLESLQNEQTLIYCSTPSRARRFARDYLNYLLNKNKGYLKNNELPLIEWINNNISSEWSLSKGLQFGIAIHDGSLQKHIATTIIKYFNEGLLKCIFCTSTIIEGVNTSAKNVILFDGKKGGNDIDFFDYSNIKGRSGRLMEHYIGKIYNFCLPPKKEKIEIDIPFYEQKIITDEILVNIPKNDILSINLSRYEEIHEIMPQLLDIIKRNGVSINGQMNIYYALERDINTNDYNNFAWTQTPNWNKLRYVLGLGENNLFDFRSKHAVVSVDQLVRYIDEYKKHKNIMHIVKDIYSTKLKTIQNLTDDRKLRYYDESIEKAFHIYRHWFQFTVPKALRVVDSLQRYVCERHRKHGGSYSYFVQQLENDFVRENLSILSEYGIPSSTIRQLEEKIPVHLSEDEVIQYIKANFNTLSKSLIQYEREKLMQCI
ncbi:DEAD/DEAH box helicase [Anaerospora sp.]|uniref:DEAD/DEAH box helicase n=1 Tax=Anaerospora sp. TaxID=1960278 RepID=UPI00289A3CD3|nr:DEAD/DEAH box helicase [Anaerospora sp.]